MNRVPQEKCNTETLIQLPQYIPELYYEEAETSTQHRNADVAIASSSHATSVMRLRINNNDTIDSIVKNSKIDCQTRRELISKRREK